MQTTLPYTHCALASPLSLFTCLSTCLVALPFHSSSSLASPLFLSPLPLHSPLRSPSLLFSPLSPLFLSALSLHSPLYSPLHSPTSLASPLASPLALTHYRRQGLRAVPAPGRKGRPGRQQVTGSVVNQSNRSPGCQARWMRRRRSLAGEGGRGQVAGSSSILRGTCVERVYCELLLDSSVEGRGISVWKD